MLAVCQCDIKDNGMMPVIFQESMIRAVTDFGRNLQSVGDTHTGGDDWSFNTTCRERVRKGGTVREAAPVIIQLMLSGLLGQL